MKIRDQGRVDGWGRLVREVRGRGGLSGTGNSRLGLSCPGPSPAPKVPVSYFLTCLVDSDTSGASVSV